MKTDIRKIAVVAAAVAVAVLAVAQNAAPGGLLRRPGMLRNNGMLRRPGVQAPAASAEEAKPIAEQLRDLPTGTNGVPLLDFDTAPIEILLMSYAKESGKVLLPAPNLPKTQITLSSNGRELDKETYLQAIEVTLTMNGIVIEPFGGSGTTMIACEQLGRKCRMMELDPHYCTVIIARWEKLTGQKAIKLNP